MVGISLIAKVPLIFLATPGSGITSLPDLVKNAQAAPGRLNYASAGIGGTQHLSGEMFENQVGVFITHIPYCGSGPAQADFLGAQLPLMVDSVTAALPHIRSGRAVPLAVTSATRSSQRPDVPTVRESGSPALKGMAQFIRDLWSAPAPTTGPEFDRFLAGEIQKWGGIVKTSGASVE